MDGKLIIFSAPSGAGKTTIVKYLLSVFPELEFSVSATTRNPREFEENKKDYYFFSKEDFLHRIANHEFIEFEEVYNGIIYGTLKSEINRIWSKNKHVIFDVDVIGGIRLKRKYGDKAMAVFVQPPSIEILRERLIERDSDNQNLEERLKKAEKELNYAPMFDISLENYELGKALNEAFVFVKYFLKSKIIFGKRLYDDDFLKNIGKK